MVSVGRVPAFRSPKLKIKNMKTIEEKAKEVGILSQYKSDYPYDKKSVEFGYMTGANEQKVIDDAELLKLKSSCEREAQIKYDDEANYKQGYHDAVNKACELLKAVGVLTDDDSIMGFIKAMEE